MYVILVNDDNSLYGSKKERIMQRSKLVNNLVFIVDPIYKGVDMPIDASICSVNSIKILPSLVISQVLKTP